MQAQQFNWKSYQPTEQAVLCFLRSDQRILLIHKKRGLGAGKINGPGGKRELPESLQETACRETREEVGMDPTNPSHAGILRFAFSNGYLLEVHVFLATEWTGQMTETDEAVPFWVHETEIPWDRMWQDDRYWLPKVLAGATVEGEMFFEDDRMTWWDLRFSDGVRDRGPSLL